MEFRYPNHEQSLPNFFFLSFAIAHKLSLVIEGFLDNCIVVPTQRGAPLWTLRRNTLGCTALDPWQHPHFIQPSNWVSLRVVLLGLHQLHVCGYTSWAGSYKSWRASMCDRSVPKLKAPKLQLKSLRQLRKVDQIHAVKYILLDWKLLVVESMTHGDEKELS
jgi:hypothetical protein